VFWFGRRRARARALREIQAFLPDDVEGAWACVVRALKVEVEPALLRAAADVARARGDLGWALRLDRAADDPSDPARLADAAAHLERTGAVDAALALLHGALMLAPFDAVLRSELALVYARAARPAESAAVLALHPCLAADPGALFQFAWSSMLAGDLASARECLRPLEDHTGSGALSAVLASALERSVITASTSPTGLREFLFLEHGALLLDASGPHAGVHREAALDATFVSQLAPRVRDGLGRVPPRVTAACEDDLEVLSPLAAAWGMKVAPPPRGGVPDGLLASAQAASLEPWWPRLTGPHVRTLALWLPLDGRARVPDLVGAVGRRLEPSCAPLRVAEQDVAWSSFVRARRAWLEPTRARVARPFVRDAPIAWP